MSGDVVRGEVFVLQKSETFLGCGPKVMYCEALQEWMERIANFCGVDVGLHFRLPKSEIANFLLPSPEVVYL